MTSGATKGQKGFTLDGEDLSSREIEYIFPDLLCQPAVDFNEREFTTEKASEVLMVAINGQPGHPLAHLGLQKIIFISTMLLVSMIVRPPNPTKIATAEDYVATFSGFEHLR